MLRRIVLQAIGQSLAVLAVIYAIVFIPGVVLLFLWLMVATLFIAAGSWEEIEKRTRI